jgi:hypothetical protein
LRAAGRLREAGFFLGAGFAALVVAAVPLLFLAAGFLAGDFFEADFLALDLAAVLALGFAAGRDGFDAAALEVSIGHLPDMTFCAASATASAISEPSLVALAVTDFAAFSALSAASIPASLIALRALGLAAIAAAAAVSPAASISLLIAALASLSIVSSDFEDFELDEFEADVRLVDLAIATSRCDSPIRQSTGTTVPLRRRKGKGNRRCRYV